MAAQKKNNTYNDLIMKCPLRPIQTAREQARAALMCDELTDRISKLNADEEDYLSVLTDLLINFEESQETEEERAEHRRLCNPRAMLMFLMDAHKLSRADLALEFGGASRVSDFLNGKRDLSKAQIQKLARRFNIAPSLFFGAEPYYKEFRPLKQLAVKESSNPYLENLESKEEAGAVRVNFSWTGEALAHVKAVAQAMGVPYQSYIKQVLYRQALEDEKQLQSKR